MTWVALVLFPLISVQQSRALSKCIKSEGAIILVPSCMICLDFLGHVIQRLLCFLIFRESHLNSHTLATFCVKSHTCSLHEVAWLCTHYLLWDDAATFSSPLIYICRPP